MLSQSQVDYYTTFGFLVLRDYFSTDEVETIKAEYKSHSDVVANFAPLTEPRGRT